MNLTFSQLLAILGGEPVALWGEWVAAYFASGQFAPSAESVARIAPQTRNSVAGRQGSVAVVPISGVITPRPTFWEQYGLTTSVATIVAATRAALADPNVKAVVHQYDSPGGSTAGVSEGHAELLAMRGRGKPIIAQVDHMAASAAYWLASAADEIASSPSGLSASVGVYQMHTDLSGAFEQAGVKHEFIHAGRDKVLGNGLGPLDDAGRAYKQGLVDAAYASFTGDVARGRGVSVAEVQGERYGLGRVLTADTAQRAGVVDVVRSMSQTLAAYGAQPTASGDRQRRALALRLDELD